MFWSLPCTAEIKKHVDDLQLTGLPDISGATQYRRALFAAVGDAKLHLRGLQKQVNEGQPTPSFIQALAAQISGFTQLLNTLKASHRQQYASLLQQEQQLLQELEAADIVEDYEPLQHESHSQDSQGQQNADGFSPSRQGCFSSQQPRRSSADGHAPATTPRRRSTASAGAAGSAAAHSSAGNLLPEVAAYDNFLAKHGPTGGWHPDDHNTFMSVLRSNRGDYSAAVPAAADALPMHTRQAILAHCRWHADFMELDMRRRVALVNWRAAKDAQKLAMQAEAAALQDISTQVQQATHDQLEKEVRQVQKQRVEQWRQQRQQQAQQEAVRLQQERERQLQELEQKRAALKQRLEVMRSEKQQQAAASAAPSKEPSATSARPLSRESSQKQQELLQRLQRRNSATFERRQQLMTAKEEKQAARDRAQQQLLAEIETVNVDRDPNRLLAATASAASRRASKDEADGAVAAEKSILARASMPSGFVLHIGHKAVPAWASGMR
eukprot:GHUV01053116.1.p1 GENE.GHUV01053116.1~~GHUV01053116.1.p1  ORF type:complete len:497 (+),score=185.11 GHUV01053116.1:231-1721(+)